MCPGRTVGVANPGRLSRRDVRLQAGRRSGTADRPGDQRPGCRGRGAALARTGAGLWLPPGAAAPAPRRTIGWPQNAAAPGVADGLARRCRLGHARGKQSGVRFSGVGRRPVESHDPGIDGTHARVVAPTGSPAHGPVHLGTAGSAGVRPAARDRSGAAHGVR